jgi:hypothetical protein
VDHRTPGDIAMAIHRIHRTPPISLNPQPIPSEPNRSHVARRDAEAPDSIPTTSEE